VLETVEFTEADIEAAVREISSSSPGPDQFPAELIVKCTSELRLPFFLLWQRSMHAGSVRSELRNAHVVLMPKGSTSKKC